MIQTTTMCPVCDVAAWVGPYPPRHLREFTLEQLAARCQRLGVRRAIVSGYDQLFAQNGLELWEQHARRAMAPVGGTQIEYWPVVNPAHPGELRRLREGLAQFAPRGVRLLPNYHQYRLWDPAAADLMGIAAEHNLVVQVFVRISDERWHWMLKVPPVDVQQDVAYLSSMFENNRLLISGASISELASMATRLRQHRCMYADLSRVRGPAFFADDLHQQAPIDRLLFGSLWPVQIMEASLWEITGSKMTAQHQRAVLWDNAEALIAAPAQHDRNPAQQTHAGA